VRLAFDLSPDIWRAAPPAPPWDWRDQVTCCICAPHSGILLSADWHFLWRLARWRYVTSSHIRRLDRIVTQLDRYAVENGITWP
jgi:hypothetical protein